MKFEDILDAWFTEDNTTLTREQYFGLCRIYARMNKERDKN